MKIDTSLISLEQLDMKLDGVIYLFFTFILFIIFDSTHTYIIPKATTLVAKLTE